MPQKVKKVNTQLHLHPRPMLLGGTDFRIPGKPSEFFPVRPLASPASLIVTQMPPSPDLYFFSLDLSKIQPTFEVDISAWRARSPQARDIFKMEFLVPPEVCPLHFLFRGGATEQRLWGRLHVWSLGLSSPTNEGEVVTETTFWAGRRTE